MTQKHQLNREQELYLNQYEELAQLAGGLAHEVRNPLSSISMNIALLSEELEESDTPKDRRMLARLNTVQKECQHLEGILNAFLQFARAGELHLEPTDLTFVLEDFIEFYQAQAQAAKIKLVPHLSGNLPPIQLDRSLMRQVLLNLAINAQQAMPDGGQLELITHSDEKNVVLEMIDTGQGMSPTTKEQMFEAFFSDKPGGSGLGLPTVRKIIEAHHGQIQCESEPQKGTRFVLTFPIAES